jgi:hypothetical protein
MHAPDKMPYDLPEIFWGIEAFVVMKSSARFDVLALHPRWEGMSQTPISEQYSVCQIIVRSYVACFARVTVPLSFVLPTVASTVLNDMLCLVFCLGR